MNHITVHKIIKHSLNMHPFKRHTAQRLTARDMERRLHFCEWIIEQVSSFKNAFFVLLLQQQSVVATYQTLLPFITLCH